MDLYTDAHGPPNRLFKNMGNGKFTLANVSPEFSVFRNTYQSTWADYDNDGDADVYIANDFSPNYLFRNDGNGVFLDVSEATGTTDIGFGMGAAWGDYNNDGRQDLYVTNMYSKAGLRITSQFAKLDKRYEKSAHGNSLFRNDGDTYKRVSGFDPPAMMVEKGGWGWGSQFMDVDNDGYLDIYALSGYYSAPKKFAIPIDH